MAEPTTTGRPTIQVRRDSGLYGYERALKRVGLAPVAGADEAGPRRLRRARWWPPPAILSDAKSRQIAACATPSCCPPPSASGVRRDHREGPRLVGGDHRAGGVRPARHARGQRRGAAAGPAPTGRAADLRADRRLPRGRPRGARAGGLEGRPGGRLRGRGFDHRQGDPGPDHVRAGRRSTRSTSSRSTRATARRCTRSGWTRYGPSATHRMRFENVRRTASVERGQ